MRLSPFKALLAAHFQTSWNRSARELGRQGAWVMGLLMALIALFGAVPLFFGMGALGWLAGGHLDRELSPGLLGGALALISLGGGFFAGVTGGGARQLSWEAYRGYPLKLRTLYLAELVAGIADPFPLLLGLGLTGFLSGVALGSPATLPLLPLVLLETLLTLLALQLLVGGLAAALVKRLRLALALLGIALWLGSTLTATALPRRRENQTPASQAQRQVQAAHIQLVLRRGAEALSLLPSHGSAQSLTLARQGRWGAALAGHVYPLAFLALLMILGARIMARESRAESVPRPPGRADRLWTFRTPAEGVARLHFRTLMASHLGKFALLMPLLTLVLLKGPFSQLRGQSSWGVPAAFAYLAMVGNNFVLNQFGLDRHGIKGLLLLPIPSRDLLLGKLMGMALHQALQALGLILLLSFFDGARPLALLAGLLMLGSIFLAQSAVGQWTSAWTPRPMALNTMKNNQMPMAVGLLSLGTSLLWTSLFGGLYALTAWLAPGWLVPVMALAFGLTLTAHLAHLPTVAAYLDRRREVLVERLG